MSIFDAIEMRTASLSKVPDFDFLVGRGFLFKIRYSSILILPGYQNFSLVN